MRKSVLLFLYFIFIFIIELGAQTVTKYAGLAQVSGTDPVSGGILKDAVHFNQPYGLAFDGKDNLWITDKLNHTIRLLQKSDGKIYTRVGYTQGFKDATGVTAQFDNPMGLAINAANEIFVADNGNHCIRKISAFGNVGSSQTVTNYAGKLIGGYPSQGYADGTTSQAMFSSPTDVAVDASGNIYIADAGNNAIRKITVSTGTVTTIAGGPTKGGYADGTLANAKFNYPTGIFITSTGDIYVADHNNQKIRKISGSTVSTVVSGLSLPDDVVVTSNGTLYITDQHKIVKYSGSSVVFAGSVVNLQSGYVNGEGTLARFNNVKTMVLRSSDNSLYVADNDNHVIRQVSVSTTSNPPKCSFTANKTTVGKTGTVTFTDQSTNNPTSRKWTFTGGSPATLSTSATATVTYAIPGTYSVKLVVTNVDGKDSLTKANYITVTNVIGIEDGSASPVKVYPSPATDMIYLNPGNLDMGNATLMIATINGKFTTVIENHFVKDNIIQIPVNDLQAGIYLLLVKTSKDVYRFRFVKQ